MPSPRRRRLLALFKVLLLILSGISVAALIDGWRAFGTAPGPADRARMEASPRWCEGSFCNPEPIINHESRFVPELLQASSDATAKPGIPVFERTEATLGRPPDAPRVTWMGHSTVLIELDGLRVLTDPVWGARVSPFTWAGPRRFYRPPVSLEALGEIDVVLISHDHYDHLDQPTVEALSATATIFVAPLGVAAHLRYWGVREDRIRQVDWWDEVEVDGLLFTATPARHASGRHLLDRDRTLWCGYAIQGESHRLFFSGDTGLFPAMKEIGARLGPFDLAMVEVGAYNRAWPDWHIGPEQAVLAAEWMRSRRLLPIHWGLFNLAPHGWTEPMERVRVAARRAALPLWSPRPGEPVELGDEPDFVPWWPTLPFRTAAENPIVSSGVELTELERQGISTVQ